MFKVIKPFADRIDGHVYGAGDIYPHEGAEATAERLAELSTNENACGEPLILEEKPKRKATKKTKE